MIDFNLYRYPHSIPEIINLPDDRMGQSQIAMTSGHILSKIGTTSADYYYCITDASTGEAIDTKTLEDNVSVEGTAADSDGNFYFVATGNGNDNEDELLVYTLDSNGDIISITETGQNIRDLPNELGENEVVSIFGTIYYNNGIYIIVLAGNEADSLYKYEDGSFGQVMDFRSEPDFRRLFNFGEELYGYADDEDYSNKLWSLSGGSPQPVEGSEDFELSFLYVKDDNGNDFAITYPDYSSPEYSSPGYLQLGMLQTGVQESPTTCDEQFMIKTDDINYIEGYLSFDDSKTNVEGYYVGYIFEGSNYFSGGSGEPYVYSEPEIEPIQSKYYRVMAPPDASSGNLTICVKKAISPTGLDGIEETISNGEVKSLSYTDLTKPKKKIETPEDLYNIRFHLSQDYTIAENINLENDNWIPIGHYINSLPGNNWGYFTGSIDGGFNEISNMTIIANSDYFPVGGSFGFISELHEDGEIKNLNFINSEIITTNYSSWISNGGLLVGTAENNTSISKCSATGEIIDEGDNNFSYVGGLLGVCEGNVSQCWTDVDITINVGSGYGGLIGAAGGSDIVNSYSSGEVNGDSDEGGFLGLDWGAVNIENCYYDSETSFQSDTGKGEPRTTDEMTYPYDEETTYVGWDFSGTWSINSTDNNGYPFLIEPRFFDGLSNFDADIKISSTVLLDYITLSTFNISVNKNLEIDIPINSLFITKPEHIYPIVRTDGSRRQDDGQSLKFMGTLVDPGPYKQEFWDGDIEGFFEYKPDFMLGFEDAWFYETGSVVLPNLPYETAITSLAESIDSSQTEITVDSTSELKDTEGETDYCTIIESENTFEIVGYESIDGNTLVNCKRGQLGSMARSFDAGTDVLQTELVSDNYKSFQETAFPVGQQQAYQYRAVVRIDTTVRNSSQTFYFRGDVRTARALEDIDFSGIDRAENFIDARDLESEEQLLDRAKLNLEEMQFESWNTEEFKQFAWEDLTRRTDYNFENLTLEELIVIADEITEYAESELINQLDNEEITREDIEEIIADKLDVVTADEIDGWAIEPSKLVLRLLTGEPAGAYDDWSESEIKDTLKTMLTNEIGYDEFETNFPFEKWEENMEAKLNVDINNNTSIEVEYLNSGPYAYMQDFRLGDVIIAEYPGEFRAMIRIIGVKEERSSKGKKITLTLGKQLSNLISKIKSDSKNVGERL